MAQPKVAILSAMETVNPKVPSTIEAAALCKMAERGQITGGVLDGPLALDNAIDLGAAKIKKITSVVGGQADILIVPVIPSPLARKSTVMALSRGPEQTLISHCSPDKLHSAALESAPVACSEREVVLSRHPGTSYSMPPVTGR